MAKDLRGLSVFVASPGGLEQERQRFFEVLSQHSADDAQPNGITFMPQGHEMAFAGAGRPQELINDQVRNSDYLIVIFWDKWGSPTSVSADFSSGTEEELHVGIECLEDSDRPMRDVVVFFKGVSDRQMADPGEEFSKVLGFKSQLEQERRVLYRTFDTIDEFGAEVRRLLSKWTRDWSAGEAAKAPLPVHAVEPLAAQTVPSPTPEHDEPTGDESLLDQAKSAAKRGQNTLAHQLYTKVTTASYDRVAWTEYVRFLRRTGRLGLMYTVADRMIDRARDSGDHRGAAEAFSNIAIAKRSQGQRSAAIRYFDSALTEVEHWEDSYGAHEDVVSMRAFILDNKGLTWRRMNGMLGEAEAAINESIILHGRVGDSNGQAHGLRNIGVIKSQLGQLDDALVSLEKARAIFEEQQDERALAMTISSIGETLELKGDVDRAVQSFELALQRNTDLGNNQGKSMNLSQLSRAHAIRGDERQAREYAEACLALNQRTGSSEGLAAGMHAIGRVLLESRNYRESRQYLEDALDSFQAVDQPAGIAGTALDLAALSLAEEEPEAAQIHLVVASTALDSSPHFGLNKQYERLMRATADALGE